MGRDGAGSSALESIGWLYAAPARADSPLSYPAFPDSAPRLRFLKGSGMRKGVPNAKSLPQNVNGEEQEEEEGDEGGEDVGGREDREKDEDDAPAPRARRAGEGEANNAARPSGRAGAGAGGGLSAVARGALDEGEEAGGGGDEEEDGDFLTVRRRDHALAGGGQDEEELLLAAERAATSAAADAHAAAGGAPAPRSRKKKKKQKIDSGGIAKAVRGSRLVFDDASGEALPPLAALARGGFGRGSVLAGGSDGGGGEEEAGRGGNDLRAAIEVRPAHFNWEL